jgi:hypothetical protein
MLPEAAGSGSAGVQKPAVARTVVGSIDGHRILVYQRATGERTTADMQVESLDDGPDTLILGRQVGLLHGEGLVNEERGDHNQDR